MIHPECLTIKTLACAFKRSRLTKGDGVCAAFLGCLFIQYRSLALPVWHMQRLAFVKNYLISAKRFLPSCKDSQHKKQQSSGVSSVIHRFFWAPLNLEAQMMSLLSYFIQMCMTDWAQGWVTSNHGKSWNSNFLLNKKAEEIGSMLTYCTQPHIPFPNMLVFISCILACNPPKKEQYGGKHTCSLSLAPKTSLSELGSKLCSAQKQE